ncbi:MAG: hypothetical protein RIT45_2647, partial [Pseudomonadota bacterium]
MMRALATALALGLLVAGCTSTSAPARNTLRNPRDLALLCLQDGALQPIADCTAGANVRAYVTGGSVGSIAIADPVAERWIDADPAVPGFSPRIVGDLPQAIVADPEDGELLYFGLGLKPRVGRMRADGLDLAFAELDFVPAGMVAEGAGAERALWIADPEGGAVWRLPVSAFDTPVAATRFDVGGSPWSLAAHPDGRIVVGHLEHDHATVLGKGGAVLARVGLGPACGDGIDNDGDGFTDAADRGCDDAADDNEADPELGALCSDNVDNDGDGHIDALDPGCAATPTVDHCRDGIDNDGDGLTDFPDDPGCSGFGGASEALDGAPCADGVDNDGDGLTDFPADSDCASATDAGERATTLAGVLGPCSDGIDNDGDGLTDFPADSDCGSAHDGGERRPACADGLDNDGDGLTDLADRACYDRTSPAEVDGETDPVAAVAVSFDGRFATIGHRARRALYVLDMATLELVQPKLGATSPVARPSRLDARDGLRGLALPAAPLAMTPVRDASATASPEAMAISLSMSGLVFLRFDATDEAGATVVSLDFVAQSSTA